MGITVESFHIIFSKKPSLTTILYIHKVLTLFNTYKRWVNSCILYLQCSILAFFYIKNLFLSLSIFPWRWCGIPPVIVGHFLLKGLHGICNDVVHLQHGQS